MDKTKHLVFAILKFLDDQHSSGNLSEDNKESIEVASQCLEAVYDVYRHDEATISQYPLPQGGLQAVFARGLENKPVQASISDSEKEEADAFKTKGNEFMKKEEYKDALEAYTKAIQIDCNNAVYYCNRAAAHSKLDDHRSAIEDCMIALNLDPNYGKAFGRMGLAHAALNEYEEAKECYMRALEIDPSNDSYKNCLEQADQKCKERASNAAFNAGMGMGGMGGMNLGGMDFGAILNNPGFMNMAANMMQNPQMQQMMQQMMGGAMPGAMPGASNEAPAAEGGAPQPPNMEALMRAGQQMAEQLRQQNPELVEQLKQQVGQNPDGNNPPPPPPGTS